MSRSMQVLSIGDNREFQIISGEDENGQLQVKRLFGFILCILC